MTEVKEKYDIRVRSLQGAYNGARFVAARIRAEGKGTSAVAVFDRAVDDKALEGQCHGATPFLVERCLCSDLKCFGRVLPAGASGVRFLSGTIEDAVRKVLFLMERFGIGFSLVRDVKGGKLVCLTKK